MNQATPSIAKIPRLVVVHALAFAMPGTRDMVRKALLKNEQSALGPSTNMTSGWRYSRYCSRPRP